MRSKRAVVEPRVQATSEIAVSGNSSFAREVYPRVREEFPDTGISGVV